MGNTNTTRRPFKFNDDVDTALIGKCIKNFVEFTGGNIPLEFLEKIYSKWFFPDVWVVAVLNSASCPDHRECVTPDKCENVTVVLALEPLNDEKFTTQVFYIAFAANCGVGNFVRASNYAPNTREYFDRSLRLRNLL